MTNGAEKLAIEAAKKDIIEAYKEIHRMGLSPAWWGNVSIRIPGTEKIVITPSGMYKWKITPGDMMVMNVDGKILEGIHKPSSEAPSHMMIYENRPDVNSVVHTHSPYATSFGVAGLDELPVTTVELFVVVGGPVPVIPWVCAATKRMGKRIVEALGKNKNVVILRNHGLFAVGPNLQTTLDRAELTEDAARLYILSSIVGKPSILTPDEIEEMMTKIVMKWGPIKTLTDVKKDHPGWFVE